MAGRTFQSSLRARPNLVVPAVVLVLLAGCWALVLPRAETTVFARVPSLDEVHYLDRAHGPDQDLTRGFMSPLYPWLIRLSGSGWAGEGAEILEPGQGRGLRVAQIACWLAVVLLLHLTARRLLCAPGWDPPLWLTWLPAALFVLYRPAAIYTLSFLLEIPLLALVCLFLFLLTCRRRPQLLAVALGLVLGMAGLLRGTVLVLAPLAAWRLWELSSQRGLRRALVLGLLTVALLAPLLPAVVENSARAGRLAVPTFNGGLNLYIGNSAAANGLYVEPVGRDKRTDPAGTAYLARRLGRPALTVAQADSVWAAAARQAMADEPGRALALFARKLWLHLQSWEIDQLLPLGGGTNGNGTDSGWTRGVPILGLLVVPYGLLVVLGLTGLVVTWRDWPAVRRLAVGLASLMAIQSVFFVVTRYRLVLVPILCLGAAAGVAALARRWPERRWGALIVPAAALVLTTLVVQPWGLAREQTRWRHLGLASEAQRWALLGRLTDNPVQLEEARLLYEAAAPGLGADPAPWLGWATACRALGRNQEAEEVLTRGLLRVQDGRRLRHLLVGLFLEQDRPDEALVQIQALVKAHPDDAEAWHNGAVVLARLGRSEQALDWARRFLAAHPGDARAFLDLGVLLARAGEQEAARRVFEEGLAAHPGHQGLRHNLQALE